MRQAANPKCCEVNELHVTAMIVWPQPNVAVAYLNLSERLSLHKCQVSEVAPHDDITRAVAVGLPTFRCVISP